MKLKPIMRLTIAPLLLILLLSASPASYSMDYITSRRTAKPPVTGVAKEAAAVTITTSPASSAGSDTSAIDTPLPASTILGRAGAAAPGARSYAEVAVDLSKSGLLRRPATGPGAANTKSSAAAAAPITITVPTAPIAIPAGAPKSPRATANGLIPPVRPAGPLSKTDSAGVFATAAAPSVPAAAAPTVVQSVPDKPVTPKTVVVTDALPITSRMAGTITNMLGYPETYRYRAGDEERFLLGRMQRELVRRAKSYLETEVSGAVEILQEAKDREISIGASFADNAYKHLRESSNARSAELEAQITRLNNALIASTRITIDSARANIDLLAQQLALRKQGRDLAAERAAKSRSEAVRVPSPVADYTKGDNTAAEAELIAAITTYISKTRLCYLPAVKATARLTATTVVDDRSGGVSGPAAGGPVGKGGGDAR